MFANIIEQIGPKRILPARQWMQCALTATLRPTNVCLTFDGGLRCQYDVALPVLRYYGLTAFWFVQGIKPTTGVRQLWMGNDELKELHDLAHVIGLHSQAHPLRLERFSVDKRLAEYGENYNGLKDLLGEPPQAMSHACNSYNRDTLTVLRELGIKLGFRANMASPGRSELEYPREDPANLVTALAA
jgi:peptidoglycan/xylan/chitin deacetylase (PgdA/CDA1 family)